MLMNQEGMGEYHSLISSAHRWMFCENKSLSCESMCEATLEVMVCPPVHQENNMYVCIYIYIYSELKWNLMITLDIFAEHLTEQSIQYNNIYGICIYTYIYTVYF